MFYVGANGTLEAGVRHGAGVGSLLAGYREINLPTVAFTDMNRPTHLWGKLWSLQTTLIPVTKWQTPLGHLPGLRTHVRLQLLFYVLPSSPAYSLQCLRRSTFLTGCHFWICLVQKDRKPSCSASIWLPSPGAGGTNPWEFFKNGRNWTIIQT